MLYWIIPLTAAISSFITLLAISLVIANRTPDNQDLLLKIAELEDKCETLGKVIKVLDQELSEKEASLEEYGNYPCDTNCSCGSVPNRINK